jgi:multidrug efflux pump subunit AcrA (membrane-fusion protein)
MERTTLEEIMAVEAIVTATTQQGARAAQQAAQAAQQEAQQAAQAAQQEAQQAAREAAQIAREAAREAIRDARREAARAGRDGQPGVVFPPFSNSGPQVPEGAIIISVAFFVMCAVIAIGFPIARAIARRMDRRSSAGTGTDSDTRARLERIEQAVDAIAVEVERISEGQRFTTKVMSEMRSLPLPDASAAVGERGADLVAVPLSRTRETR